MSNMPNTIAPRTGATPTLPPSRQALRGNQHIAWIILVLGLIITAAASMYMKYNVEKMAEPEFVFRCNEVKNKISKRLSDHARILRSGRGLFDASNEVTRKEWRIFTKQQEIQEQFPCVQGIGFSLLIPHAELAKHIQEVRSEGFPEYSVKPDGDREIYSSIIFLEPFFGRNLRAFGYDMLSDPVRRAAMEEARDADSEAISAKVVLIQETGNAIHAGTLMYVPVYRKDMPTDSVEQRRAAIRGWIYSPYRMNDLMQEILGPAILSKKHKFHINVYDGSQISSKNLLYECHPARDRKFWPEARFTYQIPFDFNGHIWTICFKQTSGGIFTAEYIEVWLTKFGGVIISFLLFALTRVLLNTRAEALRMAEKLTVDLRESEKRYAQLAEQSNTIAWEVDAKGLYTYVSGVSEAVLGYRPDELVGKMHFYDLHPESGREAIRQAAFAVIERKEPFKNFVNDIQAKDGRIVWVSTNGLPLLDDYGTLRGYCGSDTDISERKQVEEEKAKLESQLRQAQKMQAMGQLAGGISQDFNNLLSLINGYSQVLLMDPDLKASARLKIEDILQSGEEAAGLTRQLLVFSRRHCEELKTIDLDATISDLNEMLRRIVPSKILMEIIPHPDLWKIKADPGNIEQIMMNLVSNAADAMPTGGKLTVKTENVKIDEPKRLLDHSDIKPGAYVVLSVNDTGCGMDASVKEHIFEPFFTTKEVGKGAGLGLATVYGIVKQSNAHIDVQSEPGKGAKFLIYFPKFVNENTAEEAQNDIGNMPRGSETILLAEDEDCMRDMLQTFLHLSGYAVIAASNGEEALELAGNHKGQIHILLTDIVMPKMNGFQLAKHAEELFPGIKLLFMSGYAKPADSDNRMDISDNFIEKPINMHALAVKLREILGGKG